MNVITKQFSKILLDRYSRRNRALFSIAVFLALLIPIVNISIRDYKTTKEQLTDLSIERRQTTALVAAESLRAHFSRIQDIALSFATRPVLVERISEGEWESAGELLRDIPINFPEILAVNLVTPSGIAKYAWPPAPEVIGGDFSNRDWYRGVSSNWQPYISEVFQWAAEPKFHVSVVAVPVRYLDNVVAILLVQIKAETLIGWGTNAETGLSGHMYFVDQNQHVIYFDKASGLIEVTMLDDSALLNSFFANQPLDDRGIQKGVVNDEYIIAKHAPDSGWKVVVAEPISSLFQYRDQQLERFTLMVGVRIFVSSIFALIFSLFLRIVYDKLIQDVKEEELVKYKLAVDNSSDHIILTNVNGVIIYANRAAEDTTGFSVSEMVGQTPALWGRQMPQEFYKKMWHTIKEEKKPFLGEVTNRRKNGEIYQASTNISPVLNDDGEVKYFIGIERDITREKMIDKTKSEFVSLASHQLRTPLSSINWYIEMLLAGDAGPVNTEQQNYLKEIYTASKRMVELINALLNLSRMELGTFVVDLARVDLTAEVRSLVLEMQADIQTKHLVIKEEFEGGPVVLLADRKLIRMVIQNILSNSIKYSLVDRSIDITLRSVKAGGSVGGHKLETNSILFAVTDRGLGIPASEVDKIFGKFYRAKNASASDAEGSGLGLYLIKSIVEATGGQVWFVSEEHKETTFFVVYPETGMLNPKK